MKEKIVGVLHDALEDTDLTLEDLRAEGFPESVLHALDSVTRRTGEDYHAFILRAAANPIGRRVKLADLTDKCNLSRISKPTPQDYERLTKYRVAIATIRALG